MKMSWKIYFPQALSGCISLLSEYTQVCLESLVQSRSLADDDDVMENVLWIKLRKREKEKEKRTEKIK